MVLSPRRDRERAVQLLVHDDARQFMRERQWAETPALLGTRDDVLGQPIGIADHKRDVAALHFPAPGQAGELLRRPCSPVRASAMRRESSGIRASFTSRSSILA